MNIPNEKVQRTLVHLVELRGPTRVGGHATLNRLMVGNDNIEEMELFERRGSIRVVFRGGLIFHVPLSNVGIFLEANDPAKQKFKSHKESIAPVPVPVVAPKPVKDDTIKL